MAWRYVFVSKGTVLYASENFSLLDLLGLSQTEARLLEGTQLVYLGRCAGIFENMEVKRKSCQDHFSEAV